MQECRGRDACRPEAPPCAGQPEDISRECREVVQLCRGEAVTRFAVALLWMAQCCAKFHVKKWGLGLHHEMWKSKRRLNPTDFR
eukprot:7005920-Pyramimonas_sp.AAC.1